jgi:MFS family permease
MRWYDLILINSYYLGLTAISQTMTPLILPLLIQDFVGVTRQGVYYGNLRLWTLMVALLVQALMGLLSDHSTLPWGKRRPFIITGTVLTLVWIAAIGFSASLSGLTGYWALFGLIILLMVATNTAHGAQQGLIPDLVPVSQRGMASGIKAIFEIPLPLILVAFTIAPLIANGSLWAGLGVLMGILVVVLGLTLLIKEPVPSPASQPLNWSPFLRLALMVAVFTGIILLLGNFLKGLGNLFPDEFPLYSSMLIFGSLGLAAMSLAIGAGVFASIRIGLGNLQTIQQRSFAWWVVNRLLFLAGSTNLASFAVFFLQGRLGLIREEAARPASLLLLIVGVFILVTALPGGWLADRIGYKRVLLVSGLLAALGSLIIIVSATIQTVYLGAVLVGAATGVFYTANWALGTKIVPHNQAGRYLGIANLAGAGAGAVGAYIGGPVADYFTNGYPLNPGIGYVVLFTIYGILFLFSIFALTKIHPQIISPSKD